MLQEVQSNKSVKKKLFIKSFDLNRQNSCYDIRDRNPSINTSRLSKRSQNVCAAVQHDWIQQFNLSYVEKNKNKDSSSLIEQFV